jgi:hypothetical protein
MKNMHKHPAIAFVLFTMAFIGVPAVFGSVPFKGYILPIFSINIARANEAAAGSDANIDRI